jgi:hypothetical protein
MIRSTALQDSCSAASCNVIMHKIYCPPGPSVLHFWLFETLRILEDASTCPNRDPRMANGALVRVEGKKIPVAVVGSRSSSCQAEGGYREPTKHQPIRLYLHFGTQVLPQTSSLSLYPLINFFNTTK